MSLLFTISGLYNYGFLSNQPEVMTRKRKNHNNKKNQNNKRSFRRSRKALIIRKRNLRITIRSSVETEDLNDKKTQKNNLSFRPRRKAIITTKQHHDIWV